jgi:hypothetical protein
MKFMFMFASSLLLALIASASGTDPLSYGNGLCNALSSCPVTPGASFGKEKATDDEFHDCLQATAYIRGAADVLNVTPPGVRYGQDFEIVYAYLKNHVNQRQPLSAELIRDALLEAFPQQK